MAAELTWIDYRDERFTLRGLGWPGEAVVRRLPAKAEGIVREPVWNLAQCTAGVHLAFRSDTTALHARMTTPDTTMMFHMAACGRRGLSLFAGSGRRARHWNCLRFDVGDRTLEGPLFADVPRQMREFRLYLPQYSRPESLELGLDAAARILPPTPPELPRPVVFYGTSVTQGGCTNLPGGDYGSGVGRRLNLEVVNLGFSGNGVGEPEVAELVAEVDASAYVLDYLFNVGHETLAETLPPFHGILRQAHPDTPIVLMTNFRYGQCFWEAGRRDAAEARRDVMMRFYAERRAAGEGNLHLVDGFGLLPPGLEAACTDGTHPTDHGFQTIADTLAPNLAYVLGL